MKYMGSKRKYANELLSIILANRKDGQFFVDLFCGGCNVVDKVGGNRIANDVNYYLIELFRALQTGWIPPKSVTETEYSTIKNNISKYPPELVAYVAFQLSYGAKWFGGYRRDSIGKRDYALEAYNNTIKQISKLTDISFVNKSYCDVIIPEKSIIYCDPPYRNTTKYGSTTSFDHDVFWAWCDARSLDGHSVFVSEYVAPENWVCVWEKKVNNTLDKNTGAKQGIERLFTLKP